MRLPLSGLFLLYVSTCLPPAIGVAQDIAGTVHNQQDSPVAAVQVRWTGPNDAIAARTTDENGCYQLAPPRSTVVGDVTAELPTTVSLGQNYPTPFNPETVIPFQIGGHSLTTLTIYNISGQAVRILIDGRLSAGCNEIIWNDRGDSGNAVAAGIYIYRLTAGPMMRQRKMLKVDGGGANAGFAAKPLLQAAFTVELSGEHILDHRTEVAVEGNGTFDFKVDERFLWTARASMPTPRQEIAAATLNGKIYVFGGLDDQAISLSTVDAYAPRSDTWESRADLPIPLNHLAAVTFEQDIFIFGGIEVFRRQELSRQTLEYNPATDSWTRRADMPFRRGAHGAALLGVRIYVIGGLGESATDETKVMIYDPSSDTWQLGADLPVPSEHLAVATSNGRIYALSGRYNGRNLNAVQVYDPATDAWQTLPPMPTARHGLAAGLVDGKMYLIGDGTIAGLRASNTVEEYVP